MLTTPTTTDPLDGLNTEQRTAANHDGGPLCVLAGAGSGKTRVIERRVRVLLGRGMSPERILLLTFTKRAANEMRERLLEATPEAQNITATTYHGFAYHTLRDIYPHLKLERPPTVIDQDDAKRLLNHLIKTRTAGNQKPIPGKIILTIHSASINRALSLEDAIYATYPDLIDRIDEIQVIRDAYREKKREQHLVDFDDLLLALLKALRDPEVAPYIQERFDHVLVDEFQDTNKLQGHITWLLAPHRNVTIVADQDQAIYAFRGAHYENLDNVLHQRDMTVVTLNTNYRSNQAILNLANDVLAQMPHEHPKVLKAANRPLGRAPAVRSFPDATSEATFVIRQILHLLKQGARPNEIAVLYRSSYLNIPLQARLLREGVPFKTYGGSSLTSTAHVRDAVAFLRLILNPEDRLATSRVLSLHPGIGKATAEKIANDLTWNAAEELDQLATTGRANQRDSFHALANFILKCWTDGDVNNIIQFAIDYYTPLMRQHYDEPEQRERDLQAFRDIAASYNDIGLLISDLMLDADAKQNHSHDTVTLSTIHAAKGLEFPSVIVIGASDNNLPHYKVLQDTGDGLNEERRLAYVAITRAQENLLITYPTTPAQGKEEPQEISRYLQPFAEAASVAA